MVPKYQLQFIKSYDKKKKKKESERKWLVKVHSILSQNEGNLRFFLKTNHILNFLETKMITTFSLALEPVDLKDLHIYLRNFFFNLFIYVSQNVCFD